MQNGEIELANGRRIPFVYEIIQGRYVKGKVVGLPWGSGAASAIQALHAESGGMLRMKTLNLNITKSEEEGAPIGRGYLDGELI